jgi:hypothetical protein
MKLPAFSLLIAGVLVWTMSPCASALPEGEAAAGRLIARRYAEAIVGVKCSVFMRITVGLRTLPPTERKVDVYGTMIRADGLTMTSLSAIDPRAIFESMRNQFNTGGQALELGETEFKYVRLQMSDGAEIPAKILWKDPDHDIVLLIPAGGAPGNRSFTFVDLGQAAESASVLGNYYQISRTGEDFKRVLLVRSSTIFGIIDRPRRLFLVSTDLFPDAPGCPVFDPEGKVLGICLHDVEKGLVKGAVVVPAVDLAAIIARASPD